MVVSLVPYAYHVSVAKFGIKHKKHVVTTSYVSDAMRALDGDAKKAGIILLNECGLDPGIDHMSAMRMIHAVRAAEHLRHRPDWRPERFERRRLVRAWNISPPCGVFVTPATTFGMTGPMVWLGTGAGAAWVADWGRLLGEWMRRGQECDREQEGCANRREASRRTVVVHQSSLGWFDFVERSPSPRAASTGSKGRGLRPAWSSSSSDAG